jgi:hypothetical protein
MMTGCYAPVPASGVSCGEGSACPHPLVCSSATSTCERSAVDLIDARPDVADAPIDPSLVAWLAMDDDPSDGRIDDSAGGDHPAFCGLGVTCGTGVMAKAGSGLKLVPDQFYRLPFDAALDTPLAFTVALWLRLDAPPSGRTVMATKRHGAVYNSWAIYLTASQVGFESVRMGSTGITASSHLFDRVVPVATWIHITISWDDTTKRIYIDGFRVLDASTSDILFDNGEVLIGCDDDDGTIFDCVNGTLDDVRIYDRMLSDSEIAVLAGL